LEHSQ